MEPIAATKPVLVPETTLAAQIVNFSSRFIGSKSESAITYTARVIAGGNAPTHYHFVPQKELTSSEAIGYIPYAVLAHIVPSTLTPLAKVIDYEIIAPSQTQVNLAAIPGGMHANHNRFFDKTTGLKVMLFAKEDQVVIAFGPAASYENEVPDFFEAFKVGTYIWCCGVMANLAGAMPFIYTQAEVLFTELMKDPYFQNKTILLVGHSIGASMASYIALKHKIKAIGFNSLALGVGVQKELGEQTLSQADQYLTHLSVSCDAPSDFPGVHYIDRCLSFAGIKTPGNFGKHYLIPSPYWSQARIHNEYLNALIALVGKSEEAALSEVVKLLNA